MKVVQEEHDHGQLPEMVEEAERNTGLEAGVTLADAGYPDEATLEWIEETGHDVLMPVQEHPQEAAREDAFASKCFIRDEERDVLICPAGKELSYQGTDRMEAGTYRRYSAKGCKGCQFHQQCVPRGRASRRIRVSVVAEQRKSMLERIRSPEGRRLYALRQQSVEPVFGQMKSNRGFRRLQTWGLGGATAECALMWLAHNVAKCAASQHFAGRALSSDFSAAFSALSSPFWPLRALRHRALYLCPI